MLGALQNAFREPAFLPKGGDALRSTPNPHTTQISRCPINNQIRHLFPILEWRRHDCNANEERGWQRSPFCGRIGFEGHRSAVESVVWSTRSRETLCAQLHRSNRASIISTHAASDSCTSLPRIPNPRSFDPCMHSLTHSLRSAPHLGDLRVYLREICSSSSLYSVVACCH